MRSYPPFAPPDHLALRTDEWNAKEAREYKDWLLSVLGERTDALSSWLKEPRTDQPSDHLLATGKKAYTLFQEEANFTEPDPEDGGIKLTDAGYAFAADMGLLVARYLEKEEGVVWTIVRKSKRYIHYNKPVLKIGKDHLDPIGGSISEVYGILRNERRYDIWNKIYMEWRQDAINHRERY